MAQLVVFSSEERLKKMVRGHAKQVARDRHDAKAAEKLKSQKRDGSEVSNRFQFKIMMLNGILHLW